MEINVDDTSDNKMAERCARWISGPIDLQSPGMEFRCRVPLTGNEITLRTSGETNKDAKQVSVCDMKYI